MNCKKVIISALMLTMLSLTITYGAVAESTSEETRTVYQMEYGGLTIEIEAPYQTDPDDEINVTVRVGATEEIEVVSFSLRIYGLTNETKEDLLGWADITEFEGSYAPGESREYVHNITIHQDILPGLTYGTISCKWKSIEIISDVLSVKLTLSIPSAGFIVTYVRNKEIEQLKMAYEELNASYWELNSSYTELEEKISASSGQLTGTRNLMYAFVATTIVSVATAVLLVIRRPRKETFR